MKALLTALAFLSFVAASTLPNLASAQGTTGDQPKGDHAMPRPDSNMSRPDTDMSSEKGAQAGHKAATHRTKRRASGRKGHHHTSKKTKAPEAAPPKEG